jgi:hypothetical protein
MFASAELSCAVSRHHLALPQTDNTLKKDGRYHGGVTARETTLPPKSACDVVNNVL